MKRLYISDIHLGSPLVDNSKSYLISLLNDTSFDEIYLLGDVIDIWENTLSNIEEDYQDVIDAINKPNVIYRLGNHDPQDIKKLHLIFPMVPIYDRNHDLEVDNFICTHGQQFDYNLKKFSLLAYVFYFFYWYSERLFKIDFREFIRYNISISKHKNKDYFEDLVLSIEQDAYKFYKDKYTAVIMGHTHLPKIHRINNFIYVNCGDWLFSDSFVVQENNKFYLYNTTGLLDSEEII